MLPDNFKPMPTIGQGCYEIRVRDDTGAYRVIYVAKFAEAVYVLHFFQKKPKKPVTSRPDLALAEKRYCELLEECQHG